MRCLQRAKPCFDNEVAAILARLRRSRIVCSDETSVRIDGHTHWNWVFQNDQVVIHVVRNSRAACVVTETMAGHRPSIWVSDLYGAQQGHADLWQVSAVIFRRRSITSVDRRPCRHVSSNGQAGCIQYGTHHPWPAM
jgi:hypothetical protein